MVYARVTFGLTRSLKERPYVEAAVSQGARDGYILWHHILPHMIPVLTVISTLQVAQMILAETALSFLGLGLPPPTPTCGNMLAEGRDRLWVAPWIANLSGLAIIIVVWGINMLGNGLREHLDPKARGLG
jgi:peptide/nickel transport system permease protein